MQVTPSRNQLWHLSKIAQSSVTITRDKLLIKDSSSAYQNQKKSKKGFFLSSTIFSILCHAKECFLRWPQQDIITCVSENLAITACCCSVSTVITGPDGESRKRQRFQCRATGLLRCKIASFVADYGITSRFGIWNPAAGAVVSQPYGPNLDSWITSLRGTVDPWVEFI